MELPKIAIMPDRIVTMLKTKRAIATLKSSILFNINTPV
jgi:hypothetical protein